MKIAVYTLCKDEEKNVPSWFESAKDADYLSIADTGSVDGTVDAFYKVLDKPKLKYGVTGHQLHRIGINPWRFDDAHNAALALVPADAEVCIPLHMDERLMPGWRQVLEQGWAPGTTKAFYTYVFSHKPDGTPEYEFLQNRIHHRHGYRWMYPDHEGVYPYGDIQERVSMIPALRIEQFQDRSKDRGGILKRLSMGVREYPDHPRMAFYYGRELMYRGFFVEATQQLERYLKMPDPPFPVERALAGEHLATCWKMIDKLRLKAL